MPLDFLLEIGSEEIPDWMIEPALEHLKGAFAKLLADNKLKGEVAWTDATPRPLVVQLSGLSKGQKDCAPAFHTWPTTFVPFHFTPE